MIDASSEVNNVSEDTSELNNLPEKLPDIPRSYKKHSFETANFSNLEFIPSVISKGRPKTTRGGAPKFNKTRVTASKRSNEELNSENPSKKQKSNPNIEEAPKKRGRPPGSKNRPKDMTKPKELSDKKMVGRPPMKGSLPKGNCLLCGFPYKDENRKAEKIVPCTCNMYLVHDGCLEDNGCDPAVHTAI